MTVLERLNALSLRTQVSNGKAPAWQTSMLDFVPSMGCMGKVEIRLCCRASVEVLCCAWFIVEFGFGFDPSESRPFIMKT